MGDYVLCVRDLTKCFKNKTALRNLTMNVLEGSIYGLVGTNGAGKTTLFRIIAGLSQKTSGSYSLYSSNDENEINIARKSIGCTIEAPALYNSMTVYDNMKIQSLIYGISEKKRIDEILSLVNLSDEKNMRVSKLSYGMKQRLAIAFALLNNPKLLILDEPTNGLDPIGIIELRKLLLCLNKDHNITILIASHILSELEQLATHYGILCNGTIIKECSAYELHQECKKHIKIVVDNIEKTVSLLKITLGITNFRIENSTIFLYDFIHSPAKVLEALTKKNIDVLEFSLQNDSLETYFTTIISGEKHD